MLTTIFIIVVMTTLVAKGETKTEIISQITTAAHTVGLDPDIPVAIATVESSLNPKAVGGLGEVGLFQLRPEYHAVVPGNTGHNILTGVAYLAELKKKCGRFNDAWFVCFNYGPYNKLKYPHKTDYYKKVMREVNRIRVKRYIVKN